MIFEWSKKHNIFSLTVIFLMIIITAINFLELFSDMHKALILAVVGIIWMLTACWLTDTKDYYLIGLSITIIYFMIIPVGIKCIVNNTYSYLNTLVIGNWILVFISILIFTEILFWLDKKTIKSKNKDAIFWFTTRNKIQSFFESILMYCIVFNIEKSSKTAINWLSQFDLLQIFIDICLGIMQGLIEVILLILLIILLGVVLFAFIKINTLKYDRLEIKKRKK